MAAMTHAGKRVLLIDDDITTREIMSTLLAGEGYRVAVARNGQDAIERLNGYEKPDVILLDLNMPGMDGRGFCEVRQQAKDLAVIPLVILSGADDVAEQATALGVATYLRKPVDAVMLLDTLRQYGGGTQEATDVAGDDAPRPEDEPTWSS